MPSFDITSEVDLQECDNVVNQTVKEMTGRFDFKGSHSEVRFDKANKQIHIIADDDFKLRSIHGIFEGKCAKRGIDLRSLTYDDPVPGSGKVLKQTIQLKAGLSKEDAKKVTKMIKELGLKVQAQVQDDQVRVTAKKIDDLQAVISELRRATLEFPLQYINMRS